MSEQTGATTTTEELNNEQGKGAESGFEAITSQEDFDKAIQARIARERAKFSDYEDLKAKAQKVDELEAEKMTELEKAQKEAADALAAMEALEAQVKARDVEILRQKVGAEFNLPAELIERLQGEDEGSIKADAKKLSDVIPEPQRRVPNTWDRPGKNTSVADQFAEWSGQFD